MTPRPTPLFWPLSGADFTRSIKWSRTQINAVAAQIREKLSSLAPTLNRSAVTAGTIIRAGEGSLAGQPSRVRLIGGSDVHGAEAASHPLGTKYLNTLIHAKPAAQSGDLVRNSADTPDRGRLGGNFPAHTKSPDQCALGSAN